MPQCSYKGGEPGFVRVVDEQTLAFPSYDGNGTYLSLGNLAPQPAGRDPVHRLHEPEATAGERDRLDRRRDPLLADYAEAQLIVRVRATDVLPNCSRYVHRLELVERSRFVPHDDHEAPIPDWKRREWARDVLAAGDPANDERRLPTEQDIDKIRYVRLGSHRQSSMGGHDVG